MSIVTQIQTLLNDTGTFWPLAQVLDAVNEAQLWVYAETKWQRSSWSLSFVQGTDLFTLPSDVLIPGWIETAIPMPDSTVSKTRGFPTTHRELEHFLRTWRGAALDAPRYFVIWDASTVRLFPRPDKAYTYTLWGISYPPEIVDATQTLSGPNTYILAVQYYTAALLLEATRPDLADVYMAQADDQMKALRKRLRNQQPHNIRIMRPGGVQSMGGSPGIGAMSSPGRFDIQQSGGISELPTYYPLES